MSGLRCFAAVELTDEIRGALAAAGRCVRGYDSAWADEKWVSADLMHVTLKFCGDVDERDVASVQTALKRVAAGAMPFELSVSGLNAVPSGRRCRMIWAAFEDGSGGCAALAAAIDEALEPLGIARDARRFNPHATMCRARRDRRLDPDCLSGASDAEALLGRSMSVASFSLISSRLGRREPEYETLDSWPLGG